MPYIIIIGGVIALLIFWTISLQRSLVVLDKNINNAMSQIEVQLSSRCDVLSSLLDLIKGYSEHEYKVLSESIKARRPISKNSISEDIYLQENVIAEVVWKIMAVAENYPEFKADKTYIKTMDAVKQYEKILRTSRLIYNDCVSKSNRSIRLFPLMLIARMLGFSKRAYL